MNANETPKGIRCSILENKYLGNNSNNGISTTVKQVTLIGRGVPELCEPTEDAPAVTLVRRLLSHGWYLHAQAARPSGAVVGPMMGGCFIFTCDSRFIEISRYPIPLHDRFETPEQYRQLST